jgi:DNA-binding response OmpR family regulator
VSKVSDKPTLLVVDDEKPIRHLLARIATRAGFEVDMAKDGQEALEMLQEKDYMIAIIDLMMPRLSGYELVQKISALEPRPTVIVATALTNGEVKSLDDSLVRRVIKKPFDIKAVATALVETARQIADARVAANTAIAVAPPEIATLPVTPQEGATILDPTGPVPQPQMSADAAAAPGVKVEEPNNGEPKKAKNGETTTEV